MAYFLGRIRFVGLTGWLDAKIPWSRALIVLAGVIVLASDYVG